MSSLEKQRLANIARNKELLKMLNLESISNQIKQEVEEEAETKKKKREEAKKKKKRSRETSPTEPLRKSRRLQGIKIEDTDEYQKAFRAKEIQRLEEEKLEKLRTMKLPGNISLLDMLKEESGVKTEDGGEGDNRLLRDFAKLADNFSVGDFYEVIAKKKTNDEAIDSLREELDLLEIYDRFVPNQLQLAEDRLAMIQFHPSNKEKIILGGDIQGNLGIWSPSSDTEDEPAITKFNLHGKTIAKIAFNYKTLNKVYTASYDNSIRCTDLKSLKSTEILGLLDENGHDVGVSDIQISTPASTGLPLDNTLFFTTLNGQFGSFDIRTKPSSRNITLHRLSDKKIGGFSINPSANHQISTASLDRTLKIWDMRQAYSGSKWSEKFAEEGCLHSYGAYSSRLSVSISDWNSSGDIVCNGYADTINIFNLGDTSGWKSMHLVSSKKKQKKKDEVIPHTLVPDHSLKHNCRTGKWVSILKARWQVNPRDGYEKFVIGNMQKYMDVYTASGIQVAHLSHSSVTAVPAVASFHPTENWLVGGTASGKCVLFS